jgi:hypothetical protein
VTRFVSAVLLHLQLEGEVRQGLFLFKNLIIKSEEFDSKFAPFLIACMQIFGAVFTEIVNIFLICG